MCPPGVSTDICMQKGTGDTTTSGGETPGETPNFRDAVMLNTPSSGVGDLPLKRVRPVEAGQSKVSSIHEGVKQTLWQVWRSGARRGWGRPAGDPCCLPAPQDGLPHLPRPGLLTIRPWRSLPTPQSTSPLSEKLQMERWRSVLQAQPPPPSETLHPPEGADGVDWALEEGQALPGLEVPETQHAVGPCLG